MSLSRRSTLLLAAVVLTPVAAGLGWVLGGLWQDGLVQTLRDLGLTVAVGDPAEVWAVRVKITLAMALAAPLGVACHGALDRLRAEEPPRWRVGTDVLLLLLGGNLGLGGATIATARVAVPQALEASVLSGTLLVQLHDLALPHWALAGVVSAAILLTAVETGRLLLGEDG